MNLYESLEPLGVPLACLVVYDDSADDDERSGGAERSHGVAEHQYRQPDHERSLHSIRHTATTVTNIVHTKSSTDRVNLDRLPVR